MLSLWKLSVAIIISLVSPPACPGLPGAVTVTGKGEQTGREKLEGTAVERWSLGCPLTISSPPFPGSEYAMLRNTPRSVFCFPISPYLFCRFVTL